MEKKGFLLALFIWFFVGGFGLHRFYIKGDVTVLIWYWLANFCTLGLLWLIDLFLINRMIEFQYLDDTVDMYMKKAPTIK